MKKLIAACVAGVLVLSVSSVGFAAILAIHNPVDNIGSAWANSAATGGKASGYNNGSSTTPGKHWAQADDFVLDGTTSDAWQITSLSFVGGTELDAVVDAYRISVYQDDSGNPEAWDTPPLFRYEEDTDALNHISATVTNENGTYLRWLHEVTLDTSDLGLTLNGATTYYLSIEADCTNTTDTHGGYDTYFQRFYMVRLVDSNGSTDINGNRWVDCDVLNDGNWAGWEGDNETDFVWTVEGVPEPATIGLLGLGALSLIRRKRKA